MPVCAKCGTDNPDIAKFCLACGSPIETQQPDEEERRPVSAVFCDIVGSTSRAEQLDPEDVLALLEPYYARLRAVLEGHGGTVEKFIGDAVVAVFGAPIAHEDDPERAVRAGLAILDQIRELNEEDPSRELRVRVGVTTGEALVALGPRSQERGLAWGDTLNTAARLQSAAPVNGIIVDQRTYRSAAVAIEFRELEPIEAKGKAEPVRVWEVVSVKEVRRGAASDAPLVGRAAELDRLTRLWTGVVESGKPGLATLVGEAGIGKSRLLAEAARRAEGARVHWGRCLSYGEGITYWPVAEIVRDAAGILGSDEPETVSVKLGALLESLPTTDLDQLRTMAAALSNLVGVPTTPRGTFTAAEISQTELHWGIRRTFELLAAERPLVLVFEDLHWAEPTLLELILTLMEAEGPMLVLASARPELAERQTGLLHESAHRLVVRLQALTEEESRALVTGLLAERGLDASAVDRLLANAGGNPLFLEETARMLMDTRAEDVTALSVPNSLQALVGARLDGLPPPERRLAQHASVAGTIFWSGAAAHLDGRDGDHDTLLETLDRREIVREHETSRLAAEREWEFRHIIIRDVAYGRLPRGRRVGLHVRFADWLATLPGAEEEFVEILAHHLEQACLLVREIGRSEVPPPVERAVAALVRAAERAERREGIREARRYYDRALGLVGDDQTVTRLELRLRRARVLIVLGDLRGAASELSEVADLARDLGRLDLRCESLIGLGNIEFKQGRAAENRRHLAEAESIAAELGESRLGIRAAYEAATGLEHFAGDSDAAVEKLEYGLALAEEEDDRALQIEGHLRLGSILQNVGDLVRCERHLRRCLALAEETGSLRDDARATYFLADVTYYHHGDLDESERLCAQAAEWFERTGDSHFQIQNLRRLATIALARSDPKRAEDFLTEALPLALEEGTWLAFEIYRLLAEALVLEGRVDDAQTIAQLALTSAPEEDAYARSQALLAEALVEAADLVDAPRPAYAEALRLLEEQQLWLDLAEARRSYARVARTLGDETAAAAELADARDACARTDAVGLLAAIGRELGGAPDSADGQPQTTPTTVPVPVPPTPFE